VALSNAERQRRYRERRRERGLGAEEEIARRFVVRMRLHGAEIVRELEVKRAIQANDWARVEALDRIMADFEKENASLSYGEFIDELMSEGMQTFESKISS